MPNKKVKKRRKKTINKVIHYVQLRTYRQWPNEANYMSHLEVYNTKIKPLVYDIDYHLNKKWINIRRPQLITQLNETHQEEIKKYFLHKTNLIDYKYLCLINQFDENEKFLRESFVRSNETIDDLLYLYQQIENGERHIYEYRLDILKFEFEQEKQALKHLFIDREFNELDNQINVLNAIEQDDALKQFIQFKLEKRQLQEKFVRDINMLHTEFKRQIAFLKSTFDKTIRVNSKQTNIISKQYFHLYEKTHQSKDRIDKEITSISILKRKINEIKKGIDHIDTNRSHVNDKLNRLKQCSQDHQTESIFKKSYSSNISQQNKTQLIFRRFCVLTNHIQKSLEQKLVKAERILSLVHQCHRLEFEDENLLLTRSTNNFNQISYLSNCHLESDTFFDELSLVWKRFAHVQMDIYIRIQEKNSHKKFRNFFKQQLTTLC